MVYSSIPARIECMEELPSFSEEDSLSYDGSCERSRSTAWSRSTVAGQVIYEHWNASFDVFDQPYGGEFPVPEVVHRHPNSMQVSQPLIAIEEQRPQSLVEVPALKDLYPSEEATTASSVNRERGKAGVACHETCISTLSRLPLLGRGNTRARVEMLQHQLRKPFRVGKRMVSKTGGALECFKEKDEEATKIQSMSQRTTEFDGSFSDDFSEIMNRSRGLDEHDFVSQSNQMDAVKDQQETSQREIAGIQDRQWHSSSGVWPREFDDTADPPGEYCPTKQQIRYHFYETRTPDQIVASARKAIARSEAVITTSELYSRSFLPQEKLVSEARTYITKTPTASTDTSDDDSVFVLEDDLD